MSKVKGKNTEPELQVRKYLHAIGFRYTLHGKYRGKKLPGKPDLVLPAYRSVVFVHGCFWHAHDDCKYFTIPETRKEFWTEKLFGNRQRDLKNTAELEEKGWKVFVIWTCELKTEKAAAKALGQLGRQLTLQKKA